MTAAEVLIWLDRVEEKIVGCETLHEAILKLMGDPMMARYAYDVVVSGLRV